MESVELQQLVGDESRRPVWIGVYSPEYRYERDQVVTFWHYVYIAERGVPLHNPGGVTNDYYWKLLRNDGAEPSILGLNVNAVMNSPQVIVLNEPYYPNNHYFRGQCVTEEGGALLIAIKYVPENVEGGITNTDYWVPFADVPDRPVLVGSCDRIDASVFQYETSNPSSLVQPGFVCNYLVGSAGVILTEDWEVLLGLRADNDTWALWGGKANVTESMVEACAREIGEEIGLELNVSRYTPLDIRENFHSKQRCLTAYSYALVTKEERDSVRNMEPTKCKELRWFKWNALPENLWQNGKEMIMQAVSHHFRTTAK